MTKKHKSQNLEAPPTITASAPRGMLFRFIENTFLQSCLIPIIAFALYANTLGHQWAVDDTIVITENPLTQKGIDGIKDILSKDTFSGYFKDQSTAGAVSGGRYRPLTLIFFALLYQLFGADPFWFHLFGVLTFTLLSFVLYKTLLLLFSNFQNSEDGKYLAWMSSMLFVVHPIHTEAVANIKGCDETMTLLLSLSSMFYIFKAFDTRKRGFYVLACLSLFFALLAKENAVTFLGIIPLALYFFRNLTIKEIIGQTWSLVIPVIVFLIMRYAAIPEIFSKAPMEILNNPYLQWKGQEWIPVSTNEKYATIFYTLLKYLILLFYPIHLTHDYYPFNISILSFKDLSAMFGMLLNVGLFLYASYALFKGKKQLVIFGILFYFLSLSIVSNIVFPIGTHMNERFLFMPSVGFVICISGIIFGLIKRFSNNQNSSFNIPIILFLALSSALAVKTIFRNLDWYNNTTLFLTDIKTSAKSPRLNAAIGLLYFNQAGNEKDPKNKEELFVKAFNYSTTAIEMHPTYKSAYLNRGVAAYHLKKYDQAIADLEKAISIAKGDKKALMNISLAYCAKARALEASGEYPKALEYLNKSFTADSTTQETIWLYGMVNGKMAKYQESINWFKKLTQLRPNDVAILAGLEWAYRISGDIKSADQIKVQIDSLKTNSN